MDLRIIESVITLTLRCLKSKCDLPVRLWFAQLAMSRIATLKRASLFISVQDKHVTPQTITKLNLQIKRETYESNDH
jgi:hypothetical protein